MEPTEYEQCLDLMEFYEVYCSPDSGVIEGNLDGWVVMGCVFAIVAIVAALVKDSKKKTHQRTADEFDIFN